jgi:hypothetical protein
MLARGEFSTRSVGKAGQACIGYAIKSCTNDGASRRPGSSCRDRQRSINFSRMAQRTSAGTSASSSLAIRRLR